MAACAQLLGTPLVKVEEEGLELSSLVVHHPATEHVHKEFQNQLPAEALAEALARGKAMDLEKTAEGILRQGLLEAWLRWLGLEPKSNPRSL